MKHLRLWVADRSILFVLLLLAIYFAIISSPALFSGNAFGGDVSHTFQTIDLSQLRPEYFLSGSIVVVLLLIGWSKSARLTSTPHWSGVWAPVIYALFTLVLLGVAIKINSTKGVDVVSVLKTVPWGSFILLVLLIGLFEECLFRGAVFHGFELNYGPLVAALVSSVLFGAMHFINWVTGEALGSTFDQIIQAGMSGLLYVGITLRMNSIWFGVVTHAIWDGVINISGKLDAAAIVLGSEETVTIEASSTGDAAAASAGIISLLVKYFQPLFGVFVLWSWWRQSKRPTATAQTFEK